MFIHHQYPTLHLWNTCHKSLRCVLSPRWQRNANEFITNTCTSCIHVSIQGWLHDEHLHVYIPNFQLQQYIGHCSPLTCCRPSMVVFFVVFFLEIFHSPLWTINSWTNVWRSFVSFGGLKWLLAPQYTSTICCLL